MKRAKFMLLAIVIVAIVGAALAFKAKVYECYNVYCATKDAQNVIYCTTVGVPFKTKIAQFPSFSTPCITWHNSLGLGATRTSSYYTTSQDPSGFNCPAPVLATVTTTICGLALLP
jgi:hypothetical protein